MLSKSKNSTNVAWSFSNDQLNADVIQHIIGSDSDAIRLVGQRSQLIELVGKSKELRKGLTNSGKNSPIILDSFFEPRGFIRLKHGASMELTFGQEIRVTPTNHGGDIEVETSEWGRLFQNDAPCFLGAGVAAFVPHEVNQDNVLAKVSQAGVVHSGLEIHCPKTRLPPSFDDVQSLLSEVMCDSVDCIVIPGFEDSEDISILKKELKDLGDSAPWLILRINTEKVYRNLKELLPLVRGVLISRIELAMCMDPARVPIVTKEIMQLCSDRARMVLISSDILSSMRFNATPTRAEVSDIANASMDGADCVLLSKELSMGRFASRGLSLAKKTIHDIETQTKLVSLNWEKQALEITHTLAAVTFAAYRTAHRNKAKAIVCLTKKGNTAFLLGSFRTQIPVIAVTMSERVLRRLSLIRGVYGLFIEEDLDIEHVLPRINDKIIRDTWLTAGDKIVFVSVSLSSLGEEASNLFTVQTLS